jgi:hypothetical protein
MGLTSGTASRPKGGRPTWAGSVGLRAAVIGHPETASTGPGRGRRLRRHRFGVCHRCGWTTLVSRVGRDDHRHSGMGRTFGRLCDDCFDALLGARPVERDGANAFDTGTSRQLAGAGPVGRSPQ